jgi:hypothetical protein
MSADQKLLAESLQAILAMMKKDDAVGTLAAIDAAMPLAGDGSKAQAELLNLRIGILFKLRRDADLVTTTEKVLAHGFDVDPDTLSSAADAAARTSQPFKVAAMLTAYAERFPENVNSLRFEFVAAVLNELRSADGMAALQSFALALFDADYRCDNDLGGVRFVEQQAIDGLVAGSRIAEARERLSKLTSARNLVGMAVDRRYEPLWPALDALLGQHMGPAIGRDLDHIKQAFNSDQDNLLTRQSYIRELTWLGMPTPAAALGEHILTTAEEIAANGEYGWWLVAAHADAMGAAGNPEAGLRRYQQLNAAIPRGNWVRLNTLIDEVQFTSRNGLSLEAIKSAEEAMQVEGMTRASKAYFWQAQACALHRLGRDSDAATPIALLEVEPTLNRDAYLDAMLCIGNFDHAQALVLKTLADPLLRTDMLLKLQHLELDSYDKALVPAWAVLAARPEVAKSVAIYGRPLPEALRPII